VADRSAQVTLLRGDGLRLATESGRRAAFSGPPRRRAGAGAGLCGRRDAIGRRRGLTLLEVVLSIGLTLLLLSGVFGFYMTVLRARDEGTAATRNIKLDRALLMQIAAEIRHATDIVPGDGIGFRGNRHKLTIVKVGMPERYAFDLHDPMQDDLPPAQLDVRRITYELLWDQEERKDTEGVRVCYGLWRSEQKTFDPNPRFIVKQDTASNETEQIGNAPAPEGELIAPEIKYLEFRYFDGAKWQPRWQMTNDYEGSGSSGTSEGGDGGGMLSALGDDASSGESGGGTSPGSSGYALPQAIKITIGRLRVPPEEDELNFQKLVSQNFEERREDEVYHEDRLTLVVPLLQADQTLLSSRKYGVADSLSRQEGGSQ